MSPDWCKNTRYEGLFEQQTAYLNFYEVQISCVSFYRLYTLCCRENNKVVSQESHAFSFIHVDNVSCIHCILALFNVLLLTQPLFLQFY